MRNTLLIAKREYLEQVRGRSFRFSTALLPLLIALLMGANFFFMRHAESGKRIAIAADNHALAADIGANLTADKFLGYTVDIVAPFTAQDRAALKTRVQNKSLDGLLVIENSAAAVPSATYIAESSGDLLNPWRIQNAVNRGFLNLRLRQQGVPQQKIASLLDPVHLDTLQISGAGETGKSQGTATMIKVNVMLLLILMPILLHGMDMARSIIEEKSSRIFEVMLAVARPEESLAGKLLGTGAVGLTQIAVWAAMGAFASGSVALAATVGGKLDFHLSFAEIAFFVIYFVLGFLFYSAIFSGLGATCETAQDLQMYASLIVVPVWLALFAVMNVISHPGSPWNVAASLIPITSPFVMVPRLSIETVPAWQTAASLAILIASLWIALRLSTRLYRTGILMYGKRATLPEILRWLRSS